MLTESSKNRRRYILRKRRHSETKGKFGRHLKSADAESSHCANLGPSQHLNTTFPEQAVPGGTEAGISQGPQKQNMSQDLPSSYHLHHDCDRPVLCQIQIFVECSGKVSWGRICDNIYKFAK